MAKKKWFCDCINVQINIVNYTHCIISIISVIRIFFPNEHTLNHETLVENAQSSTFTGEEKRITTTRQW